MADKHVSTSLNTDEQNSYSEKAPVYVIGHDAKALSFQTSRTTENSAKFLLPHLQPDTHLLDIGCGTGTITTGFATHCPQGRIVGIDLSASVVEQAREAAAKSGRSATNVEFLTGSVYELPFDDASFDVVFAHQVLQYLSDMPDALAEIARVLRPGGLLAARSWMPGQTVIRPPKMELMKDALVRTIAAAGGNPEVGLALPALAAAAGFRPVRVDADPWSANEPGRKKSLFDQWYGMLDGSTLLDKWTKDGGMTPGDIERMREEFRRFVDDETAFMILFHAEVLCLKILSVE